MTRQLIWNLQKPPEQEVADLKNISLDNLPLQSISGQVIPEPSDQILSPHCSHDSFNEKGGMSV